MNPNDGLNPVASAMQQVEQVKQEASGFLQAAQAGGFGVSDRAGKAMLDAIKQCRDELMDSQFDIIKIQEDVKLGTSPDAQIIVAFNKDVAVGAGNSAVAYIESLRAALDELEAGIVEAMKHYRRADEGGTAGINRAGT